MIPGNIYQDLTPFQHITQPSIGGFCYVELAPVERVLSVPGVNPRYNTITTKVQLSPDSVWLILRVPDKERGYNENQRESNAGNFYECSVSAFLPLDSAKNQVLLKTMRYYRYIAVVNLPNGIRKLMGTLENPVRFSKDFTSGNSSEGDIGHTLTFTWTNESAPDVYMGRPSEYIIVDPILAMVLGTGSGGALGSGTGGALGHE